MNTQSIFAVYDSKVKVYDRPFMMRNPAEAIRGFETISKDKNTQVGQFPADYSLVELAEFNTVTGEILPKQPVILATGSQFIQ